MTRFGIIIMLLGVVAAGCSSKMPPPPEPLVVQGLSYDTVFETVRTLIDERYELQVEDRQSGIISTHYRFDRTLFEYFGQDSQTFYTRLESTLHLVRHRIAAGLSRQPDGSVRVVVTAYRQRQAYSAPENIPTRMAFYDQFDTRSNALNRTDVEGRQSLWEDQPDNTVLATSLIKTMRKRLNKACKE